MKTLKKHCLNLLWKSRCRAFPYHNSEHTLEVFQHVKTIADYQSISKKGKSLLQIAALFHDTGLSACFKGHEVVSANNACIYLNSLNFKKSDIEQVQQCILATKMPQNPKNELENIICDADLFHLSQPNYFIKSELLKMEWEHYLGFSLTEKEWYAANIDFLEKHVYHSQYGHEILASKKNNNLKKLKKIVP